MSDPIRTDNLTRWNRAGLEKFRYVDGNAKTYLESIRQNLASAFPGWKDIQQGPQPGENERSRMERLHNQYAGTRRDWGWETSRAFARALHILNEHVDAFANEGFITTATQWEYLRRLVTLLDYRPLPPASASTQIALIVDSEARSGLVKKGLQAKYSDPELGQSLIFESLRDIEVDTRLNGLRLRGYDFNSNHVDVMGTPDLWLTPEKSKINVGQFAVLANKNQAYAVSIQSLTDQRIGLAYQDTIQSKPGKLELGSTRLWAEPDQVYVPALNGADTAQVSNPDLFAKGQVIAWKKNEASGFAKIKSVDKTGIELSQITPKTDLSGGDVQLFAAVPIAKRQKTASGRWLFPKHTSEDIKIVAGQADGGFSGGVLDQTLVEFKKDNKTVAKELTGFSGHSLYYFDAANPRKLGSISPSRSSDRLRIEGGAGNCRSGDWFVAESRKGAVTTLRASKVEEKNDHFLITLENLPADVNGIVFLTGPFKHALAPVGFDREPHEADFNALELALTGDDLPEILVPGKQVIIESEHGIDGPRAFGAAILNIQKTDPSGNPRRHPLVSLSLPANELPVFTIGELIMRANISEFGHGETQPRLILGSGDAAETNQSFILARENISFTSDNTLEAGVRADLELEIDGQSYAEVSDLSDSEQEDPHFELSMTETGHVRLTFGDGSRGRRIPTGRNNIAVRYRIGTGSSGNNVPPYSFGKLKEPHQVIAELRQPITTSGGQDMEDVSQIRINAPDHLKSLGRGVSISDFEHIARTTPGIWNAKALQSIDPVYRQNIVSICVVPADDAPLGDLGENLKTRLRNLSSPNQVFEIKRFDPVPLELDITVRCRFDEFDPEEVETEIRSAVYSALELAARQPGQPLFVSEIFRIVEAVTGVSNSDISMFPNSVSEISALSGDPVKKTSRDGRGLLWAVWPTNCQVVYLRNPAHIGISIEEARI